VAPVITGTVVHFMFHIRCISIHKLVYYYYYYYYYYYRISHFSAVAGKYSPTLGL
jgi:hypothetical protein